MARIETEKQTKTFPEELAFRRPWRKYQARLLERLPEYMADGRLHVVAAPGSGKTVLGLEVIRRIDQPTLVLAPTITIRDQWVDRLVANFLDDGASTPKWVSTDLRRPAALTVTTYQALHAICSGELDSHRDDKEGEDEEDHSTASSNLSSELGWVGQNGSSKDGPTESVRLPEGLEEAGFRTVVVDEAHHLRSEWWRTLSFVIERLDQPRVVALTATPPYDVTPFEWERYQELCGPVDAEVSVPELVQQGDLCPHQDYVYFTTPGEKEQRALTEFRASVDAFVGRLKANAEFRAAVQGHPWISSALAHVEEILEQPDYASSLVIYLHATGAEVPRDVLHTLGLPNKKIPPLTLEWLEILLSECLYGDAERFAKSEALLKKLRHELLEMGAIERRRVKLRSPSDHLKLLTSSITKLKAVEEIVRLESGALGEALRCVVLTDFIRRGEMPREAGEAAVFEDIGIVPIFETLRRADIPGTRLGVLSGSIVVIPRSAEDVAKEAADEAGLPLSDISFQPLDHDAEYLRVELRGPHRQGAVRLLTAIFEKGGITVLVGTKSLLGEGWDAPCINTLVLASFVGSYMLSNQMRGRSIRVDAKRCEKTANIWHLVCVEPGPFGPGPDYELLVRRFGAFAGVNTTGPTIENGTARLGFGRPPFTREQITGINAQTRARALDRPGLRKRWEEALQFGSSKQMVEGLEAPAQALPGGFLLSNTIAALLMQAGFVFVMILAEFSRGAARARGEYFWWYIGIVAAIAAIVSLPWFVAAIWRFVRHGTPEWSMRQIGRAVLESLEYEGSIRRNENGPVAFTNKKEGGAVFCWLGNARGLEQTIFLRALREALSPIENPRYLLARGKIWRIFREDYFTVPEVLSRKKEFAEVFAKKWRRFVGLVQLVYTRTPAGRRLLLRARIHSLAGAFQKRAQRVSCWK
jgi:superfamily II DNA or RNA helicase